METHEKIIISIIGILIGVLIATIFYALYNQGQNNIMEKICMEKDGTPMEKGSGIICISNDCILETVRDISNIGTVKQEKPSYRNTTFENWNLYFVEYCPFEKDRDIRIGCTSWKKDIYIMGFRSEPDVMEICLHEVCHNLLQGTSLDYQEEFCERYSDTLNSMEEAKYICNKLIGELDI